MHAIDELHLEFPFMGARQISRQLHRNATLNGTTLREDIPALTDKHPMKLGHQGYPS
jgi:hypothetical protein